LLTEAPCGREAMTKVQFPQFRFISHKWPLYYNFSYAKDASLVPSFFSCMSVDNQCVVPRLKKAWITSAYVEKWGMLLTVQVGHVRCSSYVEWRSGGFLQRSDR